ncbi:MAG: chemotaxis protein CheD [Acidobacteriaceae bacterium]|jgi:chemotaxis protein CheD
MASLIVGIGDCKVSKDPADTIVTHALGSCIGIMIHDPVAKVAGLLHYMLPESSLDAGKAQARPYMFADTGIPLLIQNAIALGAVKSRLVVMAAGGAQMMDPNNTFNIGQRNQLALRKIMWKAGVLVHSEEVGGTNSRTVRIEVATGRVQLRASGEPEREMLPKSNRKVASDGLQHTHRR